MMSLGVANVAMSNHWKCCDVLLCGDVLLYAWDFNYKCSGLLFSVSQTRQKNQVEIDEILA